MRIGRSPCREALWVAGDEVSLRAGAGMGAGIEAKNKHKFRQVSELINHASDLYCLP